MLELFNGIDEVNKIKILRQIDGNTLLYKKGNRILSSYKNDDIICVILSGHVQIIKIDFNGNRTVIKDLHVDDVFGSISANIYSDEYEIIAIEDSEIMVIEFNHIIKNNYFDENFGIFLKNIMNLLYQRIKEFNNRIEIITNSSIRNKLLSYFKLMTKNNNLRFFVLPFSYSELANYLAINRSAMSREIKALKDERLIEIKGRKIKLLYND